MNKLAGWKQSSLVWLTLCLLVMSSAHAQSPAATKTANEIKQLTAQIEKFKEEKRYEDAIKPAVRLTELRGKTAGVEHPLTAAATHNLAELYDLTEDFGQAESLYKKAFDIRKRKLGAEHPDTLVSKNKLANATQAKLAAEKAEAAEREVEKMLGQKVDQIFKLLEAKRFDEALPLAVNALALSEKTFGADQFETANVLGVVAAVHFGKGEHAQAEALLRRSLTLMEKTRGMEHLAATDPLDVLALLYAVTGEFTQAESVLRRALAIREKHLGAQHPDTVATQKHLDDVIRAKLKKN